MTTLEKLVSFGLAETQKNNIEKNYSFAFDFIVLTTTKQIRKVGTKNVWQNDVVTKNLVSELQHGYGTNKETRCFFKRLGGKESFTESFTSQGKKVVKSLSTSPNNENRTIRDYKFLSKNYEMSTENYLNKVLLLLE